MVCGSTLVIDELDAKIQPVLLRYVIMLFNNMEINRHGAQLVFTSRVLSTMNGKLEKEASPVTPGNEGVQILHLL